MNGRVSDVNGPFLANSLADMGIPCTGIQILGDDSAILTQRLRQALSRSRVVILTGGLGPTDDDMTRQVLCDATGRLRVDFPTLAKHMPASGPDGAELIKNPKGSAAGLWMDWDNHAVVALPGVPWELTAMWPEVAARLVPLFADQPRPNRHMLRTVGLTEREVERRVLAALGSPNKDRHPGMEIGVSAKPLAVDVYLSADSPTQLNNAIAAAHTGLGDHIFTETADTLAEVVGAALRQAKVWVACAESCTGGAISAALTAVPGASDYVDRGVVSYSNDAKQSLLGVPNALLVEHGAVSEPVAVAMAQGLLARSQADIALSVTGIAGPGGGTPEKPVGLVVMALASADGTFCRSFHHAGDRARVVQRTVTRGLDLIRRYLLGGHPGLSSHFPHHDGPPPRRY